MRLLRFPYSVVSRLLALLLLAAAVLKLAGLAVDPVGRIGLFTEPTFQIAVIEFEFFLAAWLLWGKQPLGSWATALAVFTIFAIVSAYQGFIGRASCGCFGQLTVSPWYAFGLDVSVLAALILARPELAAVGRQPWLLVANLLPALHGLCGAFVILATLTGLANWSYGSPDSALAHFRGERISLYPRTLDVGTGAPGDERETAVEVVNRTNHPIRLLGGAKN